MTAPADDGSSQVVARAESFPLCVDFLPDGRMLLVAGPTLLRQEPDGSLVPHADLGAFGSTPFNDIVVDDRGNAYVNNIGFDFGSGDVQPGWVVLVRPDGQARLVADGLMFPNGMAVSAESCGSCLTAYDIDDHGGLSPRAATSSRPSTSDAAGSPASWAVPTGGRSTSSPTSGARRGRWASAAAPWWPWRSTCPGRATRSLTR